MSIKHFLAACLLFTTGVFIKHADAQIAVVSTIESIPSFISDITVNQDNSIDVTETITYTTGPSAHHGIYRDIRPVSSTGKTMPVTNVTVTDESGTPYMFTQSSNNGDERIKIGDPNVTFTGQKIYKIHYKAGNATDQRTDIDEIYWNVTGNTWPFPVMHTEAMVHMPQGAQVKQSACYYGIQGSKTQCGQATSMLDGVYQFDLPSVLNPSEGLTVAVGFDKGLLAPYTAKDTLTSIFDVIKNWGGFVVVILFPFVLFSILFMKWYRTGRDPKGTGVIVPQYDVPDNITPMEMGGILSQRVDPDAISAEIIYLAVHGYIQVHKIETVTNILFTKNTSIDYELIKLKDFSVIVNEFDKKLLESLFNDGKDRMLLSSLPRNFYTQLDPIRDAVFDSLLNKGYYKNIDDLKVLDQAGNRKTNYTGLASVMLLFIAVGSFYIGNSGTGFLGMVSFVITLFITTIMAAIMPAKTEKGVATKEYILGLKEYLQIAEKDRLAFHNAPEKRPEVFDALLPFAMALEVDRAWAKEFKDIYTTPPDWYSSTSGRQFDTMALSNSLSEFSVSFSSVATPPSSSGGGSGGGGSSGGGGGGGGGGSW